MGSVSLSRFGSNMNIKKLTELLEANGDSPLFITLPSGESVPNHFHVTEVGHVYKTFIDCGGTCRESVSCLLQVWTAHDVEHRLTAGKLSKILKIAEKKEITSPDLPIEVEYGDKVASQYVLVDVEVTKKGLLFILIGKQTDCLAPDKCGVSKCANKGCC